MLHEENKDLNMTLSVLQDRQRLLIDAEVMRMVDKHNEMVNWKKQKSMKKKQISTISCEAVEKVVSVENYKTRFVSTIFIIWDTIISFSLGL